VQIGRYLILQNLLRLQRMTKWDVFIETQCTFTVVSLARVSVHCSAILYIIVQSVGAVTGAGILKGLTATTNITRNVDVVCTPTPSPGVTLAQTFGVEAVITFVLVLTVFATCDSVRTGIGGSGPLAIGLSITMCHLWAVRIIAIRFRRRNVGQSISPVNQYTCSEEKKEY